MARRDQVLSLFGASPAQILQQIRQEEQTRMAQMRSPEATVGFGLGRAVGRAFGGEDPRVTQARQQQSLIRQAKTDVQQQRAQAQAQQQAVLDQQLGGLEGALLSEATGRGALPEIQQPAPSREQAMMTELDNRAQDFDAIATRLESVPGFEEQANMARNKATEARLGVFSLQKTLADISKSQRGAAPKFQEIKEGNEIVTYRVDADGTRTEVARAERYKPEGTKVDVTIDKPTQKFLEKLGGGLSDEYTKSLKGTRTANKTLATIDRMDTLINSGEVITGTGAEFIKNATKVLNKLGFTDSDRPAATETFFATSAGLTLELLKTGALGTGNSITEADKDFMREVSGNKVSLDENAIRDISRINRQVTGAAMIFHNMLVDDIKMSFPDEQINLRKVEVPYDRLGFDQAQNPQTGEIIYLDPYSGMYVRADGTPVQ
jgi:hypothetical protein